MADVTLKIPIEENLKERLGVDRAQISEVCQKFDIVEFGIFGSVLRDDFRAEGDNPSDVDVLIVFGPEHQATWKGWLALQDMLEGLFRRKVDVVQKKLLRNPYRRAEILSTNCVIYEQ